MLRCALRVLRPRPSSLAARSLAISSLSHLLTLSCPSLHSPQLRCFTSLEDSHNDKISRMDKFLASVNLLDVTVAKRDLAAAEPLLRSMDIIEAKSDEHDKEQVLASLEAYSKLNDLGVQNASIQVTLARSVADFCLQKLQQPELAVTNYLHALDALPALNSGCIESLQVYLLSRIAKCYKQLGRDDDAEEFFLKVITAHEQHRQRRGLSPSYEIDAQFHSKSGYEVLDLQLGFMENLLNVNRWDEVGELVEKVVEQIEDAPQMNSQDKLAEIQVIINKSVEWLAETDKLKPRIGFDIFRSLECTGDFEQLLERRREINKIWGLDPEDGVQLLERERALINEFRAKKANVYFVQARDAYNSVCERIHVRDSSVSVMVDAHALCPSTDDEERLLSGLTLSVASTLVDYAENLAAQKEWTNAKEAADRALQLAEGCSISLHHLQHRVDKIMEVA
ncbi:unnamed protein product [Phytophthora fragariaefolia]|uniref:Unnamed protein product n=1 Tax=Phytophthora fragariaefolia TaxID=1490495 RepID=A0A9W6UC29_9STRA|nr:unnamed protein product [Phytophthora fragariaefolia]